MLITYKEVHHSRWRPEQSRVTDNMEVHVWKVNRSQAKQHTFLIPRDIRGIIIGKSGFRKTTLLTDLLLEPDVLDYHTISLGQQSSSTRIQNHGSDIPQKPFKNPNQSFIGTTE